MIRKSIPNRSKMNSWVRNKAAYKRHEYLRDTVVWKYQKCESCMQRSLFSCVACGFCWSCHWKVEQLSKVPSYFFEDLQSQ